MPTDFWETSLGRHPNQLALCKLNFFFTYHCDFTKEEEEESKSVLLSSLCQSNKQKKAFSWFSYSFGPPFYVPAKCILAELLLLYIQTLTEIGRGKQRPKSAAATCQTALRMIEDNLELQHKHPSRLSLCTQPLLLHREPWWCRGGWGEGGGVKMEEDGRALWPGRNIGNGTYMGLPKGNTVRMYWQRDFPLSKNVQPHR